VSVVGAWSGTLSLVIQSLILVMSRMGFIILVSLIYTWYQCAKSRMLWHCFYSSSVSSRKSCCLSTVSLSTFSSLEVIVCSVSKLYV
jgi:uncharacterized membrane protein